MEGKGREGKGRERKRREEDLRRHKKKNKNSPQCYTNESGTMATAGGAEERLLTHEPAIISKRVLQYN